MKRSNIPLLSWLAIAIVAFSELTVIVRAEEPDSDAVATVIELLGDQDKEMRALGLQQVREEMKGEGATKQFVAALPKLPVDAQAELIAALGVRGDRAARPAVLDALKHENAVVRLAAFRAIGALGEAVDVARIAPYLTEGAADQRAAAKKCLEQMAGDPISPAIAAELKNAKMDARILLIDVLVQRRAAGCAAEVLAMAQGSNAGVRKAAAHALGVLAGSKQVPEMLACLLKSEPGNEREALEKAVMLVCNQNKDANRRADTILKDWDRFSDTDKLALLSVLGRVGGTDALKIVKTAVDDSDSHRRDAGIRALYNWPDASVAAMFLDLAQHAESDGQRRLALRALMRVSVLPDKRTDAERLSMLEKAMSLSTTAEERNYAIQRAKAIRSIGTLRFVVPYLDKPEYAQSACSTVVELAHHRGLREPNKAEFDKALDAVLRICKDPDLLDRAERYKKGQTRLQPTPKAESTPK